MSTSFGITYPLQRDGHSQQQRDLEARMPSYAPVEGRNVLELLYFWGQYANVVLHYDTKGVQRNWSAFFENSVPFRLAEIYQFDAEKWWTSYQGFRDKTTATEEEIDEEYEETGVPNLTETESPIVVENRSGPPGIWRKPSKAGRTAIESPMRMSGAYSPRIETISGLGGMSNGGASSNRIGASGLCGSPISA